MIGRRNGRAIHWVEAFGLSALVHVGVVFFAIDFVRDLNLFQEAEETAPDLLVTSLVLDAQTLAAATLEADAGAQGELGEGDVPDLETPEEVEPETLAAAEPDVPPAEPEAEPEPEPEEPDLPEPETPAAVEPEALTPEPVTPEAIAPESVIAEAPEAPDTLQPVAPATPLAPEPLSPLRPDDDSVAALAPVAGGTAERLSGTAPTAQPAPLAAVPATTTTRIAPVVSRPQVTPPAPPRPAVEPPAPGSPAAVVSELVAKIRANVSDACLVAMPQQASDGSPELVMLAADENGITEFAANVLADIDPRPGQRGVLIDPRQCPAATYLRENASYPAFRLTLGLTTDVLPDGEELTGAVGRAAGAYISLLLVDENGVVQDIGSYLTFAQGEARFAVPMRRDGPARDTSQMLIAIATESRPRTLDAQNGQLAEDFFAALEAEVGTGVPLVMIPFDVR